jgi:biofilm PGA synthesis protein PgaA
MSRFLPGLKLSLIAGCIAAAGLFRPALATEDPREQAVQMARQGRLAEAVDRLSGLSRSSSDPRIRFDLIVILGWAGKHREAMDVWQSLGPNVVLPDYVRPELILGLLEIRELDKAEALAADWLSRSPNDVAALIASGQVAERKGKRFDALRFFGRAEALSPERGDLHETMARIISEVGGQHGAYFQSVKPTPQQRANRAAIRLRWAQSLPPTDSRLRFARVDQVIAEYDVLIAEVSALPIKDMGLLRQLLGDRAVALVDRQRWDEVIADTDALRKIGASLPTYVRMARAGALLGLKRASEARRAYEEILQSEPGNVNARWGLFYSQTDLADWPAAYDTIDAMAPAVPTDAGATGVSLRGPDWLFARIQGAKVRAWADEPHKAWSILLPLAESAPANAGLRAALASVAAARGWPRRAEEEIRIAESLDPDDRGIQVEMAESALRRGHRDELRQRLVALGERYPGDAAVERVGREAAIRDRAELQFAIAFRDEGGKVRNAPGDSFTASTRLYSPTLSDHWRVFAATERFVSNHPDTFTANRTRFGVGSQVRHRDSLIEVTAWQNEGTLSRGALSIRGEGALSDQLSWSIGHSTFASDTPLRAVAGGITASSTSLGAGYAWSELTAIASNFQSLDFSDGNLRQSARIALAQRVYTAPDFRVTIRPSYETTRNSRTDGPYFSPEQGEALQISVGTERVVWRSDRRLLIDRLGVGIGQYRQKGYGSSQINDLSYEQTFRSGAMFEATYGIARYVRVYDGSPETAMLIFLQGMTRF